MTHEAVTTPEPFKIFSEPGTPISRRLMRTLRVYARALPPQTLEARAGIRKLPDGSKSEGFTLGQFIWHAGRGDEIGRGFIEHILEMRQAALLPNEQKKAQLRPQYLVNRTIKHYRNSTTHLVNAVS